MRIRWLDVWVAQPATTCIYQCWFNAGSISSTLDEDWNKMRPMDRVDCTSLEISQPDRWNVQIRYLSNNVNWGNRLQRWDTSPVVMRIAWWVHAVWFYSAKPKGSNYMLTCKVSRNCLFVLQGSIGQSTFSIAIYPRSNIWWLKLYTWQIPDITPMLL